MKLPSFNQHRKASVAGMVALLLVTPAVAQLGYSIVYDPTSYATLGKIWTSDATMLVKTTAMLSQMQQLYANAIQQYNLIRSTTTHFNNKLLWMTAAAQLRAESARDRYGETAGWNTALNGDNPAASTTAWDMATVQVSPGTYLSGDTLGSSSDLSSLAMVEAFDSSSPNCLNAIGQYRQLQTANARAETALEADQFDTSDSTNSQVEQLNLLNASGVQQMHETQSQGQLEACLVEQTTIANMGQRNAAATAINDAAIAAQEQAANNTNFANESNSWQNDLP